jgi:hypothetical protein
VNTTNGSITLPDGTFTYDAHPWLGVVGHGFETLVICATIIWALYILRGPLSEFIDRMEVADTPWGKYTAPPRQQPVASVNVSDPPAAVAPDAEPLAVQAWRIALERDIIEQPLTDDTIAQIERNLADDTARWATSWNFERLYNTLFGSQLEALNDLYRSRSPFMYEVIFRYYDKSRRAGFRGSPEDWLRPLTESDLLRSIDYKEQFAHGHELSPFGRSFVEYVRNQGLTLDKPF